MSLLPCQKFQSSGASECLQHEMEAAHGCADEAGRFLHSCRFYFFPTSAGIQQSLLTYQE